jgi:hypothetical protein
MMRADIEDREEGGYSQRNVHRGAKDAEVMGMSGVVECGVVWWSAVWCGGVV